MKVFFICFLLSLFMVSNKLRAQNLSNDLENLMNEARKALMERNDAIEELQKSMFGKTYNSLPQQGGIKYRHIKEKDGLTVEFELPKDKDTELNFDIKENFIVVDVIQNIKHGNVSSYSKRSNMIPIPLGLDYERPRVESKDGRMLIHFISQAHR